ncbi:phosphatase PAP2 family protein [Pedobacter sp. SL55]|uniref:phosphatase PAP2 family protein n=1 Tax=Pedobacter sp. SL55 TaxID=2995161 RepID=UPI00226D86FB|nr:phosphatase PAP2 family protein [Pedobacter sp. SL55]WAC39887.1 phosphatase PAP2 family protein [Pedobacter sp. SL55]
MFKSRSTILAILILLSFILLAIFVSNNPINEFDISISRFVQQYRNTNLDQLMIWISAFGNVAVAFVAIVITSLLFYIFKYKREALFIVAISFTGLITLSLKFLFSRPRPTNQHVTLIESYQNHSFPSGHTLSYVVFFGFLIVLMQQLKSIPTYLRNIISLFAYFMFIVGPLSRIYLGAHWFTDIIGGLLIGLLYLIFLIYCYRKSK